MTPPAAPLPMLTLLLGPPRSGLAVLAAGLAAAGVAPGTGSGTGAGPEGLLPAVRALNVQILAALGAARADGTIRPACADLETPQMAAFQDRAVDLLQAHFAGTGPAVLCDPATAALAPFWQAAALRAGFAPRRILMLRDPAAVAASLRRQAARTPGQVPLFADDEPSAASWAVTVHDLLALLPDDASLVLTWDSLMAQPLAVLTAVARFAGGHPGDALVAFAAGLTPRATPAPASRPGPWGGIAAALFAALTARPLPGRLTAADARALAASQTALTHALPPAPGQPPAGPMRFVFHGPCPVCEGPRDFLAERPDPLPDRLVPHWFRSDLKCTVCRAPPRERIIAGALNALRPNWRHMAIHESSPGGWAFSYKLKRACKGYVPSQYDPGRPFGSFHPTAGWRNENLESQTFADAQFDIVITQDVFEHIFDPAAAMREIARTLKPGGLALMTVPVVRSWHEMGRRAALVDGAVVHLKPAEYHGNPVGDGRALVTVDWSYEIGAYLAQASGLAVTVTLVDDLGQGIRDPNNVLIVAKKPLTPGVDVLALPAPQADPAPQANPTPQADPAPAATSVLPPAAALCVAAPPPTTPVAAPPQPIKDSPAMTAPTGMQFQPLTILPEEGYFTVGGLRFNGSVRDFTRRTSADEVVILKLPLMLDFYRDFLTGKDVSRVLEFGTWEGGSPLYFAAATNVKTFAGIDIRGASQPILDHAAPFADRLKLFYQTSQADRAAVTKIIDETFDGPLDLVLDDASHQYELTKKAFEIAFPRLRVGGYYIIEDWNWAHYPDRKYDDLWADQPALSNLVLELVLALGSAGPIASIEMQRWCVIIRKGANVPADFSLDAAIRMGERRTYTRF